MMLRPSAVKSSEVTNVASTGVRLSCVERPLATSTTYTYEASSKLARYAICVPDGDHVCAEIDAPAGVWSVFAAPVRGFTSSKPVVVLVVTERARLARVSTCNPPR